MVFKQGGNAAGATGPSPGTLANPPIPKMSPINPWNKQYDNPYPAPDEEPRIRSFVERYLIERASTLKQGEEIQDAHAVILQARTMYKMIAEVARGEVQRHRAALEAQIQQYNEQDVAATLHPGSFNAHTATQRMKP